MRTRLTLVAGALLAALALAGPVAAAPSCTAQFVTAVVDDARPLGLNVIQPERETLSLGGRNLGEEVSTLFARANRTACPVTP
jgi:hypothetical protein